jgi:hypothetical protein
MTVATREVHRGRSIPAIATTGVAAMEARSNATVEFTSLRSFLGLPPNSAGQHRTRQRHGDDYCSLQVIAFLCCVTSVSSVFVAEWLM